MAARGGLWLGGYLGPNTYLGPPEPLGRGVETSTTPPVRRIKARRLGYTPPPPSGGYGVDPYGDSPYGSPVATYLPAAEHQTTLPAARVKRRGIQQPGETSTGQQVRPLKRRRIGPGRERQRARPVRPGRVLEPVLEHDHALPARPRKIRRLGQAVELSAAGAHLASGYGDTPYGTSPYGLGTTTPTPRRKRRRIGPGRERQHARPLRPGRLIALAKTVETALALPWTRTKIRPVGQAADVSTAGRTTASGYGFGGYGDTPYGD